MWAEIAAAGGFIGLTGVTMRFLNAKIDKKVDIAVCNIHVKQLEKIEKNTDNTMITLAKIDQKIENIEKAVNNR